MRIQKQHTKEENSWSEHIPRAFSQAQLFRSDWQHGHLIKLFLFGKCGWTCGCAKPGQSGQKLMGSQKCRSFRNESTVKKSPETSSSLGLESMNKRKRYLIVVLFLYNLTLMFNAASSHKHKFIGTNCRQMSLAALGLLELVFNSFHTWGLTQNKTASLFVRESCLLRIWIAAQRRHGGWEMEIWVFTQYCYKLTMGGWVKSLVSLSLCLSLLKISNFALVYGYSSILCNDYKM